MTPAVTLEELLTWNNEASNFWKTHLEVDPGLLELPCSIGDTANVREFVRHIWGVELRWAQRIAGLPMTNKEDMPSESLDAVFELHLKAAVIFRGLLDDPRQDWDEVFTLDLPFLPPSARTPSRRKVLAHTLLHSQRHWAQLATLVRTAGFPSGFRGDLLLSSALR